MKLCTCGHSHEEHGRDIEHPGSMACHAHNKDGQPCDCIQYEEADGE